MTHEDIERTVALIKSVRAGRTVLMVEHNLSVVEGLVRLRHRDDARLDSREGDYASVSANPDVIDAYIGAVDA